MKGKRPGRRASFWYLMAVTFQWNLMISLFPSALIAAHTIMLCRGPYWWIFGRWKRSFCLRKQRIRPSFLSTWKHFWADKIIPDHCICICLRWRVAHTSLSAMWRLFSTCFWTGRLDLRPAFLSLLKTVRREIHSLRAQFLAVSDALLNRFLRWRVRKCLSSAAEVFLGRPVLWRSTPSPV